MGHNRWSTESYGAAEESRLAAREPVFKHHEAIKRGQVMAGVHQDLNPLGILRESRDSDNHPESNAIIFEFDETGSMHTIPKVFQSQLPKLMDTLLEHRVITDPQILIAGIGDVFSDRAPLQVGQFESDVKINTDLRKIWLEGGGGPFGRESYEVGIAWAGLATSIDCFEKRGQRGYLFISGDEEPYAELNLDLFQKLTSIGDLSQKFGSSVKVEQVIAETRKMYEIFFIIPRDAEGGGQTHIRDRWRQLLGQGRVILMENAEDVCHVVAAAIAQHRGLVNFAADTQDAAQKLGINKQTTDRLKRSLT